MNCSTPGLPVPHHLLKFACVHVHCVSNAIQPSYPLMPSLLLPSIFFSISDFSNESVVDIRWPNYWSISINPSKEFSGLISLMGLTGLISLQSKGLSGTLSSTTVQRHQFFGTLAFFMVQLSQPYMTNGKTTTLNIWTLTIQTSSTLMIHKKLKTKRTTPLRIIQNPNVILHRKSETLLLMKRVPVLDWPFKY